MAYLILYRRPTEEVVLRVPPNLPHETEIRIVIGDDRGRRRSRLAIAAPRDVRIVRGEIAGLPHAVTPAVG